MFVKSCSLILTIIQKFCIKLLMYSVKDIEVNEFIIQSNIYIYLLCL